MEEDIIGQNLILATKHQMDKDLSLTNQGVSQTDFKEPLGGKNKPWMGQRNAKLSIT